MSDSLGFLIRERDALERQAINAQDEAKALNANIEQLIVEREALFQAARDYRRQAAERTSFIENILTGRDEQSAIDVLQGMYKIIKEADADGTESLVAVRLVRILKDWAGDTAE